jgi:hypothetical protein
MMALEFELLLVVFPLFKLLKEKSRREEETSIFKNTISSYNCILAQEAAIDSFLQIRTHLIVIFSAGRCEITD